MSASQQAGRINANVVFALVLGLVAASVFIASFWLI